MADLRHRALPLVFAVVACGPQAPIVPVDTSGLDTAATEGTSAPDDGEDDDVADESDTIVTDYDIWDEPEPSACGEVDHPCLVDILVVVDNSSTMADPQLALTRALVPLVGRLERHDYPTIATDVQMMFTTTDMGHPLCEKHQKPDYTPAMGAPTTTGCNGRINRFTGLGSDPAVRNEVCTLMCPADVAPGDPFVAFSPTDANVPDGPAVDIDDDGVEDSSAAQAVACLAPQGIDGCGYEQPLETMLQALDPGAPWNGGDRPFLRDGSMVMIVLATDELDCSMDDPVLDPQYWEPMPSGGLPAPTSALCWNAGMSCAGPDADGVYSDCITTEGPLQPTSRYTNYLLEDLEGHEVHMLALTGVPLVTQLNANPPFEPVFGGVFDLVLREWRDGVYPEGDLLPQDWEDGVDVEDKTWLYKAGPGCTEPVPNSDAFVQAIPNPRVNEVCKSLDMLDDQWNPIRCCIDSICDATQSLPCIEGWLFDEPGLGPKG